MLSQGTMLQKIRTQETRHLSHGRKKASMGEKRSALTKSVPGTQWAEPEAWGLLGDLVSVQTLSLTQINVDLSDPIICKMQGWFLSHRGM